MVKYLLLTLCFLGTANAQSTIQAHVLRLKPGQDVMKEITSYVQINKIEAFSVLSAVGSLTEAHIRFANKKEATKISGPFEIVSFSGTGGLAGSHLHLSISDEEGRTLGGHLVEGNKVYTTFELVLGVYPDLIFKRTLDPTFGYNELDAQKKK